ncbi:hypothetical protein F5Y10DRAFT_231106 [Nemania abortiva]|nr:hypothetical protein F5Y10DRAFT_231106 [Nemania abortiva]
MDSALFGAYKHLNPTKPCVLQAHQPYQVVIAPELAAPVHDVSPEDAKSVFNPDKDDGSDYSTIVGLSDLTGIFGQDAIYNETDKRKDQGVEKPSTTNDSVSLLWANRTGELPIDECHPGFKQQAKGDGRSGELTLAATLDGGTPIVPSVAPPACGVNLAASGILPPLEETPKGTPITPIRPTSGDVLGVQECTVAPGEGCYRCLTQKYTSGAACIRIGHNGSIPRWVNGSTVKYIICGRSFTSHRLASLTTNKMVEATSMWQGIGVRFELTNCNDGATFQVVYRSLPKDGPTDVCAESFFPQHERGTLFVYELALAGKNIESLANILTHEIGHILGLRHEFASDVVCEGSESTREQGSVLWGARNKNSVMNYFPYPKDFIIQQQDLDELKSFYDFTGKVYKGLAIREFKPRTTCSEGREASEEDSNVKTTSKGKEDRGEEGVTDEGFNPEETGS